MSISAPTNSPRLGEVLPKSPWTNSFTYVPAWVRSFNLNSLRSTHLHISQRIEWTTRDLVANGRRCKTLIGVLCCNSISRSLQTSSRLLRSSPVGGWTKQHNAMYDFVFFSSPSFNFLQSSLLTTCGKNGSVWAQHGQLQTSARLYLNDSLCTKHSITIYVSMRVKATLLRSFSPVICRMQLMEYCSGQQIKITHNPFLIIS